MKKLFFGLALIIAGIVALVAVRTASFTSVAASQPQVTVAVPSPDVLAGHLAEAVRFKTISYSDTAAPEAAEFSALRAWMEKTYPLVHQRLSRESILDHTLLYTWKGSDTSLAPIVLMGHMDVVPVESGTEKKWEHQPFSGDIAGGYIWGRGTLDDKENVVGLLEATEHLLAAGVAPKRTVMLAFGHNEEVLGSGAKATAALFKQRGIHPAFVIDEGGAIADSGVFGGVPRSMAIIGVAEKGYQSVELITEAAGGHSSVPPRETATGIVAAGVARIEADPLPSRFTPVVRALLDRTGREMSGLPKAVMANLWLFEPIVLWQLSKSPETNAMIRTTAAPTMFSGSIKDNVLPQKARAVVNFRILPGDSIAGVLDYVKRTVNDPRIQVKAVGPGSEPSMISSTTSPEFRVLERTIHEVAANVLVTPYLVMGGTDSRHYSGVTQNVFRFSAMRIKAGDMERAHGTNERLGVASFAEAVRFYVRLIQNAAVENYASKM
jgi:carboxypeptidase PM20D1